MVMICILAESFTLAKIRRTKIIFACVRPVLGYRLKQTSGGGLFYFLSIFCMNYQSRTFSHISQVRPILRRITTEGQTAAAMLYRHVETKDLDGLYQAFVDEHCQQQKGPPVAFYEVIILYPTDPTFYSYSMLERVYDQYCKFHKANQSLGLARITKSRDEIRLDMIFSGKQRDSQETVPRSTEVLRDFQAFLLAHYPGLLAEGKQKREKKPYSPEDKRRFKQINERNKKLFELVDLVESLLAESVFVADLVEKIDQHRDMKLYTYQGKPKGILYKGQKFRFHTLGICTGKQAQIEQHLERTHDLQVAHPSKALVRKKEKFRC